MGYKIYRIKYQDYKFALEYFDPEWQQYDIKYFITKKEAKKFVKKLKENING